MALGEYLGAGSSTTKLLLHLNGNSTDSSGNGNNGTDTNITYSQANGKFGQGAGFNGSSKITTVNNIGILGSSARTISLWFKYNGATPSNIHSWFSYGALSKNNWYTFGFNETNGKIRISIYGIDLETVDLSSIVKTGYNHIVLSYSGGAFSSTTLKLYINSKEYTFASYSGTPNTTDSVGIIGSNGTDWYANGSIDEVIIENRAWTATEVQKYYTYASGKFGIQ